MKIGFSATTDGQISANALADAKDAGDFAKMAKRDDEAFAGFLDLTGRKTENRGDLSDAFEALRLLMWLHADKNSLCYAVEEMLEEAFRAGREYENNRLREDLPVDRRSALDYVEARNP